MCLYLGADWLPKENSNYNETSWQALETLKAESTQAHASFASCPSFGDGNADAEAELVIPPENADLREPWLWEDNHQPTLRWDKMVVLKHSLEGWVRI